MKFGNFDLQIISGGHLRMDGGTMFGVVPKVLWQKKSEPDEHNRIFLETNCLLVRSEHGLVLIDSGYGTKAAPRDRENFALQEGNPLLDNLARVGVKPEDVDIVILTHLHFDHAGGCTIVESGKVRPAFPRARYVVQQAEWEDASSNKPEMARMYLQDDFLSLEAAGQLQWVNGDADILPGLSVRLTGGHTRGHQIVELHGNERIAAYLGDLCPTIAHVRALWGMAFDLFPLDVRRVKPKILGEIADHGWLMIFDHDPKMMAAYIARDPKEEFTVREQVPLAASRRQEPNADKDPR